MKHPAVSAMDPPASDVLARLVAELDAAVNHLDTTRRHSPSHLDEVEGLIAVREAEKAVIHYCRALVDSPDWPCDRCVLSWARSLLEQFG